LFDVSLSIGYFIKSSNFSVFFGIQVECQLLPSAGAERIRQEPVAQQQDGHHTEELDRATRPSVQANNRSIFVVIFLKNMKKHN